MKVRLIAGASVGVIVTVLITAMVLWATTGSEDPVAAPAAGASSGAAELTAADPATPEPAPVAADEGADGEEPAPATQPDAVAPAAIGLAERPGVRLDPALVVDPRPIDRVAAYPDGVTVAVTDVSQRVESGQGPGAVDGDVAMFEVSVVNGTDDPLELSSVVVTAVYGASPGLLADPTYGAYAADLAGELAPGAAQTAWYEFAIDAADLDTTSLHIDLDGRRLPAVFTGTGTA